MSYHKLPKPGQARCEATWMVDDDQHEQCEFKKGHRGKHRVTFTFGPLEWES